MKKAFRFYYFDVISPFATAQTTQVRDFVIEPQIQPNFYIYKTFGVFRRKRIFYQCCLSSDQKGVVLFDVPWQKTQYQSLLDTIQKKT